MHKSGIIDETYLSSQKVHLVLSGTPCDSASEMDALAFRSSRGEPTSWSVPFEPTSSSIIAAGDPERRARIFRTSETRLFCWGRSWRLMDLDFDSKIITWYWSSLRFRKKDKKVVFWHESTKRLLPVSRLLILIN